MSGRKHSVRVAILGEEYSLRTDASPEHLRALAGEVDGRIRRLMQGGGVVETHKAAVLAALQLTDELQKARAALAEASNGIRALSDDVRRMLPPQRRQVTQPDDAGEQGAAAGGAEGGEEDVDWFGDGGAHGRG